MSEKEDRFYLKVWNETNRRANRLRRKSDEAWNKIWREVNEEYSREKKTRSN